MPRTEVKYAGAHGKRTEDGFLIRFPHVAPVVKQLNAHDNLELIEQAAYQAGVPTKTHANCIRYRSRDTIFIDSQAAEWQASGLKTFFNSLRDAYNYHHPIALRPEVLWQLVVNEVATYIHQNAALCAHFFTKKPDEEELIMVSQRDTWEESLLQFRLEFEARMNPEIVHAFLPRFSTTDQEAEIATLLSFMYAVSKWYRFGMYCCGFPAILVAGNLADWQLFKKSVEYLSEMFEGLRSYFTDMLGVLSEICHTLQSGAVNEEFWGSLFRYHTGSMPPVLDGWISAFIAYRRGPQREYGPEVAVLRRSEEFNWQRKGTLHDEDEFYFHLTPSGISAVTMEALSPTGPVGKYLLLGGVLGADYADLLTPRLGLAVVQVP